MASWRDLNNALLWKARETKTPLLGTFELTGRCNLSCRMCYVHTAAGCAATRELTAAQWLAVGRQAAGEGMFHLLLTGGEPLLRPDFLEIYEGLYSLGLQMSLNTNATLVTPEIARRLAALPPRSIGVTLYGASAETYSAVTGSGEAFAKALKGIHLLREADLPVSLRTTIIRQNRRDLGKIWQISRELKLPFRLVNYVFAGRADAVEAPFAVRLSPAEQDECFQQLLALQHLPAEEADGVEEHDTSPPVGETEKGGFGCAAGSFSFAVSSQGKMLACLMLDAPAVDLLDDVGDFGARWRELVGLVAAVPVCEDCALCADRMYCRVCPAKRRGETGAFDQKAPYLCEMARLAAGRAAAEKR